jgi:hypothetical protein
MWQLFDPGPDVYDQLPRNQREQGQPLHHQHPYPARTGMFVKA